MNKILLPSICFAFLLVLSGSVNGATIYTVCSSGCDFTSIQVAVNAASNGDTIQVQAGTYIENVVVNKSVNIIGNGIATTIVRNATPSSDVFNVAADWVNISGLKIEGATDKFYASIHINGANNTNISYNNATGSWYGIHVDRGLGNTIINNTATLNLNDGILLNHSNYTTVRKNIAKDNNQDVIWGWGNGICLGARENYHNVIEDNIIIGNYHGIYLVL
jgi:parallel beta-helix repeat protein